jgi:hypothetical protein
LKNLYITSKKPHFYWKCFPKASWSLKKPQISYFSLHCFVNVFKKPHNFYKSLTFSLKMSFKSFKIVYNASHYRKKASISLLIFKKSLGFFKKPNIALKKPQSSSISIQNLWMVKIQHLYGLIDKCLWLYFRLNYFEPNNYD